MAQGKKPLVKKKASQMIDFSKQIMDDVSQSNPFRKNLGGIFTGEDKGDPVTIL